MKLWLFRHAHAEPQSADGRDFDRPLSARGRAEAEAARHWLTLAPPTSACAVHVSPALRTRQTAALALNDVGLSNLVFDPALWAATSARLLERVRDRLGATPALMLIGHNPGLEGLLMWLTGAPQPLPTGAIVALDTAGKLEPAGARICARFTPPGR